MPSLFCMIVYKNKWYETIMQYKSIKMGTDSGVRSVLSVMLILHLGTGQLINISNTYNTTKKKKEKKDVVVLALHHWKLHYTRLRYYGRIINM